MSIDLNELATAIGQLTLRFRLRRRTAADWTSTDEVLLAEELGVESDTGLVKLGDGTSTWTMLDYWPPIGVLSVSSGTNVVVDNTDPRNPIINASGGSGGGSATALATAIMADSPIGYWKCNDASGGFADSSGNGWNLSTVNGTVSYRKVPLIGDNYAVIGGDLDGSAGNNGVSLGSQLGQSFPMTNWSVEAVVILSAGAATRIFDLRPSGNGSNVAQLTFSDGNGFYTFPSVGALAKGRYSGYGRPVHAAITASTTSSTTTYSTYVNGRLFSTQTASASTLTGTMTLTVGYLPSPANSSDNFMISNLAFYGAALSATRIAAHASAAGLQ